jgi:hypothetical protein
VSKFTLTLSAKIVDNNKQNLGYCCISLSDQAAARAVAEKIAAFLLASF